MKTENEYFRNLIKFTPSGRPAYDRFMRYRAELANNGDLIVDQRGRFPGLQARGCYQLA